MTQLRSWTSDHPLECAIWVLDWARKLGNSRGFSTASDGGHHGRRMAMGVQNGVLCRRVALSHLGKLRKRHHGRAECAGVSV